MVPEEWVQAILDTNSSRKKGKCGENKLVHILENQGFKEVFDWDDFFKTDYCVVKFSNILLSDNEHGEKITTQRKEINKFLKNNPDNYWVNTAGFEKLIFDLK